MDITLLRLLFTAMHRLRVRASYGSRAIGPRTATADGCGSLAIGNAVTVVDMSRAIATATTIVTTGGMTATIGANLSGQLV